MTEVMEVKKTTAAKATETARKIRPLVKSMYNKAHAAVAEGKPVAYFMVSSILDEIMRSMDLVPLGTENFAAICAAKRVAEPYLLEAEAEGYSGVVCGYVRVGLGYDAVRKKLGRIPEGAPEGGMPKPTVMLGSSGTCDPRYKWYQTQRRYMDVPDHSHEVWMPGTDANIDEVKGYYIKYLTEELRGTAKFLETELKQKMDNDRLWETIRIADETNRWWWESYQLRKAVPCPMPTVDHFSVMVPGYYMMGTQEALDFYKELYQELKYRVDNKIGVIPEEKYRLLWAGGLAPWHTLGMLNYFEDLGGVFVIEVPYRPWDPVEVPASVTDPFEYLAHRAFLRYTYRHKKAQQHTGDFRVELLLEMIENYKIDGVVSHGSRTCRAHTVGQLHWKNAVQKYAGIPYIQLVSDIIDVREYSESQWRMQIDAFMQSLATRKGYA